MAIIACRKILGRLARDLQNGIEPEAPLNPKSFAVRPIDIVSTQSDFEKLYEEHREKAMTVGAVGG